MPDFRGKHIHFTGVGGASMSALAEYAALSGAAVSGSDRTQSETLDRLARAGIKVYAGVNEDIIGEADLVVRSSAVPLSNPEITRAETLGIPVVERHEFLACVAEDFERVVAVAGTHGKTTVTAMIAHILKSAGVPFVAHIGGEPVGMGNLTVFGGDGRLPRGIFLTEACEYRRHLLALSPDVAVVTNMECDHPDCYPDIREVYSVFAKFVEKCPHTVIETKNAFICTGAHTNICADVHNAKREYSGGDTVARDAESFVGAGHDVCTYGVSRILECSTRQTAVVCKDGRECVLSLRAAGSHLLADALFAVAAVGELGVDFCVACNALGDFKGVKRRFEKVGEAEGAQVVFDYAHHPTEIACTLEAARAYGRPLVVFQPHTFTRTARYLEDFAAVLGKEERVILMPTYAAREMPEEGADSAVLAREIKDKYPFCGVYLPKNADETLDYVKLFAGEFDIVLFLGAGDIYNLKRFFV